MKQIIIISSFVFCISLSFAYAQENVPKSELINMPCETQGTVRIYVSSDGEITLNKRVVNVEEVSDYLKAKLNSIKYVCYSRENPQVFEPHPIALDVVDTIISYSLPVALFWNNEFKKRVHYKE